MSSDLDTANQRPLRTGHRPSASAGSTLFGVLIAASLFSIGGLAVITTLAKSTRLNAVNRETAIAAQAARSAIERLRALPLGDVFPTFNATASDDPAGPNTAPGNRFEVPALRVRPGDGDGMAGEIVFPVSSQDEVVEDDVNAKLGMPRDLNGDGKIDSKKHSTDYIVLPVIVRVEWSGTAGDRVFELYTLLGR